MCDFQPGLKILHVAGKDNAAADALSRRPDYLNSLSASKSSAGTSAAHQPALLDALHASMEQPQQALIPTSTTSAEW